MSTQPQQQAAYWDAVAERISESDAPDKHLVGFHSPYDVHVRMEAVHLLDAMFAQVHPTSCLAELGSGAGLNVRYLSKHQPSAFIAFDCSSRLLALAKANLSDLSNVHYIHTDGFRLPVPESTRIDVLYTVTVLQHITQAEMFTSVVESMCEAGAKYVLLIEDTQTHKQSITPEYLRRTPQEYIDAFVGKGYLLVDLRFASLTWAARGFGTLNRLYGLYSKHEGEKAPQWAFLLTRIISPIAKAIDRVLPGTFGMTAILFKRV